MVVQVATEVNAVNPDPLAVTLTPELIVTVTVVSFPVELS